MLSEILLETDGGTPFDAMQRYDPISLRDNLVSFSTSPPYDVTKKMIINFINYVRCRKFITAMCILTNIVVSSLSVQKFRFN